MGLSPKLTSCCLSGTTPWVFHSFCPKAIIRIIANLLMGIGSRDTVPFPLWFKSDPLSVPVGTSTVGPQHLTSCCPAFHWLPPSSSLSPAHCAHPSTTGPPGLQLLPELPRASHCAHAIQGGLPHSLSCLSFCLKHLSFMRLSPVFSLHRECAPLRLCPWFSRVRATAYRTCHSWKT